MSRSSALFAFLVAAVRQGAILLHSASAPIVSAQSAPQQWPSPPEMTIDPSRAYAATMATNLGDIEIALFAGEAPVTVNNFVFLANAGFYNGAPFHRVIKDFMIQTGDPTGTGRGVPGYRFADEPVSR